jgi:hypothetical protein
MEHPSDPGHIDEHDLERHHAETILLAAQGKYRGLGFLRNRDLAPGEGSAGLRTVSQRTPFEISALPFGHYTRVAEMCQLLGTDIGAAGVNP